MHTHLRTLMQEPVELFLTDAGLETMLVFLDGMALPECASFVLLESDDGIARLRRCFRNCLDHAARAAAAAGLPVVISFTVESDGRLPTGATLR